MTQSHSPYGDYARNQTPHFVVEINGGGNTVIINGGYLDELQNALIEVLELIEVVELIEVAARVIVELSSSKLRLFGNLPLLDLAALLPPDPTAETDGDFVDGEDDEFEDDAGAAAADDEAVGGGDAGDFFGGRGAFFRGWL